MNLISRVATLGVTVVLTTGGATVVSPDEQVIPVGSAAELSAALAAAGPGDTIQLAAGDYAGEFVVTAKGAADAPITLQGPAQAVLSNGEGYGLHLDGAAHWRLAGFKVSNSKKGIVIDRSSHVVIDGVTVSRIGDEGVHFRTSSSENVIKNSTVRDTGLAQPGFGEAVYVGSAESNWGQYGENGGPDRSDRNKILNNTLGPGVAAELIDLKEGTEGGEVIGNTFDGNGVSGENSADSWLDAKGNNYKIETNTGVFGGAGALRHGYETHTIVAGFGCGTVFRGNDSDLGGAPGYAIHVTNLQECGSNPNVVHSDNTATGAGSGLTNIDTSTS